MSLQKIKSQFTNGEISKVEFVYKMHKVHKYLFMYAKFIQDTDIAKIEITDDLVVFTSRNSGVKMIIDPDDRRTTPIDILNFDVFEKNDFPILLQLIDQNSIFFDIGANIGWVAINVAKMKKNTKVYAFEPVQKSFTYLKENIKINNITNIKSYHFGFSNEEKEILFYYNPKDSSSASAANLIKSKDVKRVTCKLKKLDDFIKTNRVKVTIIKCDVEGAELFVFKGGIQSLKKYKPIIFVEMLRKWTAKFNYTPNDTIRLLKNIGYCCYVANNNRLVEFQQMTEQTIETNFFFLHPKKHKDKIEKFSKNA